MSTQHEVARVDEEYSLLAVLLDAAVNGLFVFLFFSQDFNGKI